MKNIHFFPKTVKQLVDNKIVEIDFNIEQMIPEFLVNEFGMENIINAIDELKITYSEITEINNFFSNSNNHIINVNNHIINKFHDITSSEFIQKRDNRGNLTNSYTKYTIYQFSFIQRGSDLISKLVIDKYPYLSEFKQTKTVSFDPYKFINGYNNLRDIPKEFRYYTINELTSMVGIQERETEISLFRFYTSGLSDFDKYDFYLNCPEIDEQIDSLYIPYRALKENDYSIIHEKTKKYIESYYSHADAPKKLKILKCETALKLKKLMS